MLGIYCEVFTRFSVKFIDLSLCGVRASIEPTPDSASVGDASPPAETPTRGTLDAPERPPLCPRVPLSRAFPARPCGVAPGCPPRPALGHSAVHSHTAQSGRARRQGVRSDRFGPGSVSVFQTLRFLRLTVTGLGIAVRSRDLGRWLGRRTPRESSSY